MYTRSRKKWAPVTYEIKTSVADFQSDIRSGKWEIYRPYSAYIIFALPLSIAEKVVIPKGAGLIIRNNNTWVKHRIGIKNKNWSLTAEQ